MEYTLEDAKARFGQMLKVLSNGLAEAAEKCVQRGRSATWVAVMFDGGDARGMQVYRKLGPSWEELPKEGAIVVSCALGRLEKVAFAVGYKRTRGQWGEHEAGCLRVVAFTLGLIIVDHVGILDMVEGGSA
jgi:hypothetical protein